MEGRRIRIRQRRQALAAAAVLLICSVIARGVLGSSYCLEADPERVTDERYCHPELTSTIVVLPVLGACASALALVVVLTKIVRRRTLERAG